MGFDVLLNRVDCLTVGFRVCDSQVPTGGPGRCEVVSSLLGLGDSLLDYEVSLCMHLG